MRKASLRACWPWKETGRDRCFTNQEVYTTLQQIQVMERSASPQLLQNWRFQQVLYRAYYDAYTRSRLIHETALEELALAELRSTASHGTLTSIDNAERILNRALKPVSSDWRVRIFQLAEALFQSIRMQLSVKLYQASQTIRGGNLDNVDVPLNRHCHVNRVGPQRPEWGAGFGQSAHQT